MMTFDQWFAKYLDQDEHQVEVLLCDKTAIRFLIAWSIFESKCFRGFAKINELSDFAKTFSERHDFDFAALQVPAALFHIRYQDKQLYKNLMHSQQSKELESVLIKEFCNLNSYEITLMLLIVIYRFRNNIFHGNKGVKSWLVFGEQINLCINAMQSFIPTTTDPA
ncbi:MAG: hypothetical protein A2X82_03590 [Geobacteraceae bacterium GWC2_55_20]|nr:MAG: hypothetical protein A2X82_03590 [Geobacteraceae bacterium GWC2_55_20]HCE68278.1 hypothetical protein [Geobacter sp.]